MLAGALALMIPVIATPPRWPRCSSPRGAVCTSGVQKRRWVQPDGSVAHHLLDPDTGASTHAEVASVSVVARVGWIADAPAKAVILSGPSAAASLLRARNATAVVVLADGTVRRLA